MDVLFVIIPMDRLLVLFVILLMVLNLVQETLVVRQPLTNSLMVWETVLPAHPCSLTVRHAHSTLQYLPQFVLNVLTTLLLSMVFVLNVHLAKLFILMECLV